MVMKGFDELEQNLVAFKMYLKPQMNEYELAAARDEYEMIRRLNHENVIEITDKHEDDEFLYLVMDLMTDDLRNVMLGCDMPFDEATARKLFHQML